MATNTTTAVAANQMSWLIKSDLAAGATGALFKYVFPSMPGSVGMVAAQSVVFSILARVVPSGMAVNVGGLNTGLTDAQKSEILIGLLGAASGIFQKKDVGQSAIGAMAIDCLANELMVILGVPDSSMTATSR